MKYFLLLVKYKIINLYRKNKQMKKNNFNKFIISGKTKKFIKS